MQLPLLLHQNKYKKIRTHTHTHAHSLHTKLLWIKCWKENWIGTICVGWSFLILHLVYDTQYQIRIGKRVLILAVGELLSRSQLLFAVAISLCMEIVRKQQQQLKQPPYQATNNTNCLSTLLNKNILKFILWLSVHCWCILTKQFFLSFIFFSVNIWISFPVRVNYSVFSDPCNRHSSFYIV